MSHSRIAPVGALLLCACLFACSGSRNDDTSRNLNGMGRDAGKDSKADDDPTDADSEPETKPDAGTQAPSDAATDSAVSALDASSDAAARNDAGLDASPDAQSDASLDASRSDVEVGDASARDAGADAQSDASTPRNVVYASFGSMLVRIDPDTAQLSEVGVLRNIANVNQTYSDVTMTWAGDGDRAWMVTSYFQTPTLAKVDLCNGLVTLGPLFSRTPTTPPLVVEGLALHPNGNFYVSSGNPATVTSPISSNLGTLNATTGVITDLGVTATALQGDIDMLFVRGETLYGVDVLTPNSRLGLFTFDLETGKDTSVVAPTYASTTVVPLRVAYDASRDQAFAWRLSDRNLVRFDLTTGAATAIGETHPSTAYGNASSRGFFVAPAPNCPAPAG